MPAKKTIEIKLQIRDLITQRLKGLRRIINSWARGVRSLFRKLFSLRTSFIGLGISLLAKSFIDAAGRMEQFQTRLRAVIGDVFIANKVFRDLRKFAAESPVGTEDLITAFVNLKAIGIPNLNETIKKIAEVAIVTGRTVEDVGSAFVSLNTRVLRRLGIEISRTAERAVLSAGEGLKRIVIETENTAAAIRDSLIEIWKVQFPNAMQLARDNFIGVVNTFKGALELLRADIGAVFLPKIKELLITITDFVNKNRAKIVAFIAVIPKAWDLILNQMEIRYQIFIERLKTHMRFNLKKKTLVAFGFIPPGYLDDINVVSTRLTELQNQLIANQKTFGDLVKDQLEQTQKAIEQNDQIARNNSIEIVIKELDMLTDSIGTKFDGISDALGKDFSRKARAGAIKSLKELQSELKISIRKMAELEKKEGFSVLNSVSKEWFNTLSEITNLLDELNNLSPLEEFTEGFRQNIRKIRDDFTDFFKQGTFAATQFALGLESSFATAFSSIIRGTQSVSDAFQDMGNRILDTIANIFSQIAAQNLVGFLLGDISRFNFGQTAFGGKGLFVSIGNFFKGLGGASSVNTPVALAGGGVINRPTLALAGEAGPEAYVPLRNGRIPVEGNTGTNITINVNQVIQAWDARDVMRNKKVLADAVAVEIKNNATIRSAIQRYV